MKKKDLDAIERFIIRLYELNIITKNKTAEYFYDSLEMNILIEYIEEIEKNLNKISQKVKEKYSSIDWKIIEKERYDDVVFGKSMKLGKVWELASTLHDKLYDFLINILECELEEYLHLLCTNRQKQFLRKRQNFNLMEK